jgi:hypothetical protein
VSNVQAFFYCLGLVLASMVVGGVAAALVSLL